MFLQITNLIKNTVFRKKYHDNAVQFVTEDGVLLCGYVLGKGSRGITLGHANGWMVKSWLPFAERLVDAGYQVILWDSGIINLPDLPRAKQAIGGIWMYLPLHRF